MCLRHQVSPGSTNHRLSRLIYRDAVDEEGDGDISKEEFVKNAMKSKFIFNMLKE